jgi:nucleoside 2-deoxyribosyltransferase
MLNFNTDDSKDMKVYLCGPINGCTDEECNDWRTAAKGYFPSAVDPMVRDYRGREAECVNEIVELDKQDIDTCRVVLVNYDKPSVGTAMEVFYAWQQETPVVVMCKSGTSISPWLRYHSNAIVHTLKDAVEKIIELA